MELATLQEEIRALTRGVEHPRVAAALAVAEEAGEIVRCVLDGEVYGDEAARTALAGEAGDLLVALAELCVRFDVDLERAAAGALDKVRTNAPRWREELGDRLRRLRERWDADA